MPLFGIGELLAIAVKDEISGIAFYYALARRCKLPHIESALIAIAKQEEGHRERFEEMLREVGSYQPSEEYPGQYAEFLNALLETRAFPDAEAAAQRAQGAADDRDGLAMAQRLENDALIFYNELRQIVPPTHEHEVEEVIREERDHLVQIAKLIKTL